ncbi:MAG: hypothetical protein EU550_02175 [Promethearchaeota archaeon]|nr:MAG: hypothetical protein EU550_02175 [Candidatus Lokiarchaeota archaeon]
MDGRIEIEETYCYDCHRRMLYNGFNHWIAIIDKDLGRYKFRLHRECYSNWGEIKSRYYSPKTPRNSLESKLNHLIS